MIYESEISIFNKDALKTKFGSIQTNLDVTLGKISAIISDSEIEEYISGHTTMNSKLSSVVQDLDGVHTQVSSMKTDYDSHFTSVESHLTTLDTTVSGISASVSTVSQEAIKTDTIYYLATSASSGVTRSTSGWTTTTQSVTNEKRYLWIYHKYTKGDDSTTYTDPVIAGVYGDTGADSGNMLLDTYVRDLTKVNAKYNRYFSDAGNTSTTCEFISAGSENLPDPNAKYFVRIKNTEVGKYRGLAFYGSDAYENAIGMVIGDAYKASCWVRQLDGSSNFAIGNGGSVTSTNYTDMSFVPTSEWQKYEKVFTFSELNKTTSTVWSRLYFTNLAGNLINGAGTGIGQIDMCGFKLERINAIAASGRNLCLRSADYNGWGKNNGTTLDGNIITFPTVTANTWREAWQNNNLSYSTVRNQKVTVTFKIKGTAGDLIECFICLGLVPSETSNSRSKYINKYHHTYATGEWQTVAFSTYINDSTFSSGSGTPDFDNCYFNVRAGATGTANGRNGFQMKEIMVALGSDPCAWSPAPEDGIAYTDAVEVGGRNILVNSESMSNWYKGSRTTISDGVATLTGSDADYGAVFCSSKYDISVYDGSEFIWSFEYKSTADCLIVKNISSTGATVESTSYARTKYTAWSANETLPSSGGEWKKFILPARTIKLSDLATGSGNTVSGFLQLYNRTTDVVLQVRHMKLEKGNKATAWTPAPEDVSIEEIATLRYASDSTTAPSAPTSAVTSTATTTGVWTKATPILSGTYKYMYMCDQVKWETGKYTWTAVVRDSALEDLVERVTTAELKITDSAIISTVTETVGGKTALNSVIDQRADSIRLKADKISWSSTYSSMAEDGSLTVQSLTAKNYIYVNGDKRTYFRLPLYPLKNSLESQETYFEISNGGMVVKTYSAETKPGVASTEYVTTTFSNSSSMSSRAKAIQISCSANESFLEIGASGFHSELKDGTKRYYTSLDWQGCSFEFYPSSNTTGHVRSTYSYNSCRIEGDIYVTGTKNRIVSTDDYSDRLLYCYETPSPLFGDVGEGEIGEDGKCYVWLDPIFAQTVRTANYQVSLQSYSPSFAYVIERTDAYFIVGGEPGAKFGWEIKAKQADFAENRLDRFVEQREDDSVNYGLLAKNHIQELMEGRYAE